LILLKDYLTVKVMYCKKGEFYTSEKYFKNYIKNSGAHLKHVIIIRGFYGKTLTEKIKEKFDLKKAAIIHIDCDLYISKKQILFWIMPEK